MGAEDCLTLNIWTPTPAPTSPAPVIVWIPGGAFTSGSANLATDDVRRIAGPTGAIVVAMNYRVGPFGFLGHPALSAEDVNYHSSGNYGLLDQRAALGWVREHIVSFGGNPDAVTIAGQAAGAHSVSLHVVSPLSAGSFSRAIMQSGYASTRWRTLEDAELLGQDFATALGCTDLASVRACLRAKTVEQVLFALPSGEPQFEETTRAPWGPVVDRLEIPDQPRRLYEIGKFNHVPVVIETSGDEGKIYVDRSFPAGLTAEVYEAEVEAEFGTAYVSEIKAMYPAVNFPSPKDALTRLTSDAEGVCEARRIARLIERTQTPVRLYAFGHQAEAADFALSVSGAPGRGSDKFAERCDFWDRFFLGSVAGTTPASRP